MSKPILWIVIPCYNEEQVLPITAPLFLKKINDLAAAGLVSEKSRVLFVNDGSRDATWSLIQKFASEDEHFIGISQSRNRGHQNAVLAGLMEALHSGSCDITISIDCDGQDDINAMDEMVKKYLDGAEVVYGVRSRRDTDTFFKRFTAEGFYHVMNALGADIVFNHADYRLISARVLESFADYREVNIFLRGMVPLVGYPSDTVYYERHERLAGESHYPLSKMLALAFDGITSLSNKPSASSPAQASWSASSASSVSSGPSCRLFWAALWRAGPPPSASSASWAASSWCVWASSANTSARSIWRPRPAPATSSASAHGLPTKGSITDEQTELERQHPPEPGAAGAGLLRRAG